MSCSALFSPLPVVSCDSIMTLLYSIVCFMAPPSVSPFSSDTGCIKDRKGSGFFAPDIKMPTGAARKEQVTFQLILSYHSCGWFQFEEVFNSYALMPGWMCCCFSPGFSIFKALGAWARGKEAINQYVEIANTGLMLELNKLKSI